MSDQPAGPRRSHARPLDARKARGVAVDKMTDSQLWVYALRELGRAAESAGRWETRDAFYAIVRGNAAVAELYLRGTQLELGAELFSGSSPGQPHYAEGVA